MRAPMRSVNSMNVELELRIGTNQRFLMNSWFAIFMQMFNHLESMKWKIIYDKIGDTIQLKPKTSE